jgi:hypothetical protein
MNELCPAEKFLLQAGKHGTVLTARVLYFIRKKNGFWEEPNHVYLLSLKFFNPHTAKLSTTIDLKITQICDQYLRMTSNTKSCDYVEFPTPCLVLTIRHETKTCGVAEA